MMDDSFVLTRPHVDSNVLPRAVLLYVVYEGR
jgi:hypothetical protein